MLGMKKLVFGLVAGLGLWLTQSHPARADEQAKAACPASVELTEEQKLVLDFLQNEGMAGLICYGGYVISPPTPATGVTDPPRDNTGGGNPIDNTGGPRPEEPLPDGSGVPPPEEVSSTPEPASILLGLVGLGLTGAAYLRRKNKKREPESSLPSAG